MRKAIVLIIALLAVGLAVALTVGQMLNVVHRIAHVSQVEGTVLVKGPDSADFTPLTEAGNVLAGTLVKTGADSSVMLNYLDGTRIQVGADTLLTVLKCQFNRATKTDTSLFRLDAGELAVRVRKALSGESKFEIRTPTATAGVRGTVFRVAVQPDGSTRLEVMEGQVQLATPTGQVAVQPGQVAQADHRAVQVQPAVADTEPIAGLLGPYLRVSSPAPGAPVSPGPLKVRGQTEEGTQVSVNGRPVQGRVGGLFVATLTVPAGVESFTVQVEASNGGGGRSEVIRELPVAPAVPSS